MQTLKGKYGEAKVMIDHIDPMTTSQIFEFLNHEAFTNPIAIMPDTHAGKGSVIGFTMPMTDKVIPNVVGVDINCFTGDTKIPLLDGIQYSLIELLNKDYFYVYSMNEDLQIVPGKAKCIKTQENTTIIEVIVSGGEIIRCTPDEKFMLIDGSYKEAKDLIPKKDSLMPLYRSYQTRDGYETIYSVYSKAKITHRMVAEYFLGEQPDSYYVHHKNEKWYDNSPENLEYVYKNEHSSIHAKQRNVFIEEDFQDKKNKTIKDRGYYFSEEYREKKKEVGTKNLNTYRDNNKEQWLEKIKDNGKRGKKYLAKLNQNYICDICDKICGNYGAYKRHKKIHKKQPNNHKVLSIRHLPYKEDTYCLQVEKYHNFALSAGIFVHNCGMLSFNVGEHLLNCYTREELDIKIRSSIPFGKSVHERAFPLPVNFLGPLNKIHSAFVSKYNYKFGTSYDSKDFTESIIEGLCTEIKISYERFKASIGTLGGGNHFIELGKSEKSGNYWFTIHSGSRQFGLKVCNYWQKKAGKGVFAYLTGDDAFGYLSDMVVAQQYATVNREIMFRLVCAICGINTRNINEVIRTNHNFIDFDDFVIRKGAIRSYKDEKMIIPLNMHDGILICEGKSNPEWNFSAPHGAGRLGSRRWAKETLSLEDAKQEMEDADIYFSKLPLDEVREAYKDASVIENALGPTATIIDRIKPVLAMKD